MSGLILTQGEIVELTGYTQQKAQSKWLTENRFKFILGGDGKVKVSRDHFNMVMGVNKGRQKAQPDFSLFSRR